MSKEQKDLTKGTIQANSNITSMEPKPDDEIVKEIPVTMDAVVPIDLTSDIKVYACGKWWDLKKGQHKVPKQLKEILRVRGVLKAV